MAEFITRIRTESGDLQIDYNSLANLPDFDNPESTGLASAEHTHTPDSIGAATKSHTHTKSEITDFPTALPADGGNADTVDGKHADDFALATDVEELNDKFDDIVGGVTSNIQTQLDGKAPSDHKHTVANISGLTVTAKELNYVDGVTSSIQTQFDNATAEIENRYDLTSSGKAISKNDNLDDYQTPGVYSAILSVATTLSNCPVSKGFKLVVEVGYSGNTRLIQTIYAGGATVPTYTRKLEDGAWNPWASQLTSILPSDVYGSTLPTAGIKGRIFFKKVSS
jgi:hypothetical protein